MMSRYHDIDYSDPQILVQVVKEGGRGGGKVTFFFLLGRPMGDMGVSMYNGLEEADTMERREGGKEGI